MTIVARTLTGGSSRRAWCHNWRAALRPELARAFRREWARLDRSGLLLLTEAQQSERITLGVAYGLALAAIESGWGRNEYNYNCWGWRVRTDTPSVRAFRARHSSDGASSLWRAWRSRASSARSWVSLVCPESTSGRYRGALALMLDGDRRWYRRLMDDGYGGGATQQEFDQVLELVQRELARSAPTSSSGERSSRSGGIGLGVVAAAALGLVALVAK